MAVLMYTFHVVIERLVGNVKLPRSGGLAHLVGLHSCFDGPIVRFLVVSPIRVSYSGSL